MPENVAVPGCSIVFFNLPGICSITGYYHFWNPLSEKDWVRPWIISMTWPHAFSRDFPQLHALDWILIGSLPAYDITAKLTRIIANSILETSSAVISCTQHSGKQQRPKRYRRADHGLSLFSNFSKYVLRYAIHRGWRRAIRLTSLTGRAPPKSTCGKQSKAHTDYLKNLIMETSCWCTKCV